MIVAAIVTSNQDYYIVWSCAKIASTITDNSLLVAFPSCASYVDGSNLEQVAPVSANMAGGAAANAGAALSISFGAALWLAFNIHAFGVEIYVSKLFCFPPDLPS